MTIWTIRTRTSTRPWLTRPWLTRLWLTRPLKPGQAKPSMMLRSEILQLTNLPQIPLNPSILRWCTTMTTQLLQATILQMPPKPPMLQITLRMPRMTIRTWLRITRIK